MEKDTQNQSMTCQVTGTSYLLPTGSSLPNSELSGVKPVRSFTLPENYVSAHCEKHGVYQTPRVTFTDGRTFDLPCGQCKAEKLQPAQQEAAKRMEISLTQKMGWSGVPQRFLHCSFENYEVTGVSQSAFEACKAYADNFEIARKLGSCLLLLGDVGTGKTHLATAIGRHIIGNRSKAIKYETVASAIRKVRESFRKDSKVTEQQILDSMIKPDLLILDEVGVQSGSDAELNTIFDIINGRYQQEKPTLLISNLKKEDVRLCLGDRAYDRLRENGGKIVEFKWPSYRGTKRSH